MSLDRVVSVGMIIGLLAAFAGFYLGLSGLFKDRRTSQAMESLTSRRDLDDLDKIQKKIDDDEMAFEFEVREDIKSLKANQKGTSGLTAADRLALTQVSQEQQRIAGRLVALEGALINEPVKALAVPLLKKDVDDLLDREKQNATAVRAQDDRLDRLVNQIFYITFGVIGVVVATVTYFLNRNKKPATT